MLVVHRFIPKLTHLSVSLSSSFSLMTSKGELGVSAVGSSSSPRPTTTTIECCMCGDYGLPYELFRCNLCDFRSQHRYCSNLYPKAQSYRLCNWCLSKDEGNSEGTHNNSSSTVSNKYMINTNGDDHHQQKYMNINSSNITSSTEVNNQRSLKIQIRSSSSANHFINNSSSFNHKPIKKQRCLDRLSSSSPRSKKIIISHREEEEDETLRRTKSEDISNTSTTPTTPKQVFRGKARRYKLLEEVSSQ